MLGDNNALLNEETKQYPQESDRPSWFQSVMNSGEMPDNIVGNSSLSSEGYKVYHFSEFDMSESSTKFSKGVKENTLMGKLLEARLEGHKSCSKAGKSTS
ncbi:hypothetical protein Lal_00031284 [Lupinus albus]|uniref:Uncharacterized protein n=1 Tax=Lupinus albus TaxID=3870 RepID=A0A6A5LQQ4_LUPAL|nr:hypothetical protein Lalb_Chr17g0338881 [Lupinus albus]KAF1863397.1 hypothetical protein Lal_00031284 [Lupinus albus]